MSNRLRSMKRRGYRTAKQAQVELMSELQQEPPPHPELLGRVVVVQEAFETMQRTAARTLGPEGFRLWEEEVNQQLVSAEVEASPQRALAEMERVLGLAAAALRRRASPQAT